MPTESTGDDAVTSSAGSPGAVRGDVVQHDMHREFVGHAAVDEGEELLELPGTVPGGHLAARSRRPRRRQAPRKEIGGRRDGRSRGSGVAERSASSARRIGAVRSSACRSGLLLVNTSRRPLPPVGCDRVQPTSRSLVDELRVRRQLEVLHEVWRSSGQIARRDPGGSRVCGIPTAAAIDLVDHCVALCGCSSSVLTRSHRFNRGVADRARCTGARLIARVHRAGCCAGVCAICPPVEPDGNQAPRRSRYSAVPSAAASTIRQRSANAVADASVGAPTARWRSVSRSIAAQYNRHRRGGRSRVLMALQRLPHTGNTPLYQHHTRLFIGP